MAGRESARSWPYASLRRSIPRGALDEFTSLIRSSKPRPIWNGCRSSRRGPSHAASGLFLPGTYDLPHGRNPQHLSGAGLPPGQSSPPCGVPTIIFSSSHPYGFSESPHVAEYPSPTPRARLSLGSKPLAGRAGLPERPGSSTAIRVPILRHP